MSTISINPTHMTAIRDDIMHCKSNLLKFTPERVTESLTIETALNDDAPMGSHVNMMDVAAFAAKLIELLEESDDEIPSFTSPEISDGRTAENFYLDSISCIRDDVEKLKSSLSELKYWESIDDDSLAFQNMYREEAVQIAQRIFVEAALSQRDHEYHEYSRMRARIGDR